MRLSYDTLAADGLKALGGVYAYVQSCGIEKQLIDLAYLRTSQINGCAYCVDMHTHDAIAEGISAEKLMLVSVWRESGTYFSARERAALEWAEAVTWVAGNQVPDEAFIVARSAFSEKELADLTLAIGLINVYNRMAISFRKPPASLINHKNTGA